MLIPASIGKFGDGLGSSISSSFNSGFSQYGFGEFYLNPHEEHLIANSTTLENLVEDTRNIEEYLPIVDLNSRGDILELFSRDQMLVLKVNQMHWQHLHDIPRGCRNSILFINVVKK